MRRLIKYENEAPHINATGNPQMTSLMNADYRNMGFTMIYFDMTYSSLRKKKYIRNSKLIRHIRHSYLKQEKSWDFQILVFNSLGEALYKGALNSKSKKMPIRHYAKKWTIYVRHVA